MTPYEALQRAMFFVSGLCSQKTLNKPGAVIERLPKETREVLQQLKSDDIGPDQQDLNIKYYVDTRELLQEEKLKRELKKECLEFDKKILK